jgi:signal transduction histidine kinase
MDESLYTKAVETKFSKVITNILINAYESFDIKKIENKKIQISLQLINGLVCIKITDNAGGIDSSIIDKLFDPYFTTKHKFQGTGLGLFICSRIIIDHFNGNITCRNSEIDGEKGSEFLITFPI